MKELSASEYIFLKWLQETHPQLYAEAEARQQSIGGFMDSLSTVFTNIANAAPDLLKQYVTGQQELAVLKANLARAKAGEIPITNTGQPYATDAPGYRQNIFSTIPPWVLIAFGLGAVYLIARR
jgi:hypothetical protein